MTECAVVSVGLLVEPKSSPNGSGTTRSCSVQLECQPDMANLIIKVSDHDNDGSAEDSDQFESSQSGSGKSQVRYRTLERVDSGIGSNGGRGSSRTTMRNRPTHRKSRSESQLPSNGNLRSGHGSHIGAADGKASSTSPVFRSCDYYRQKFLEESLNQPSDLTDWISNYSNAHKIAGQKVVEKLAAQHKALEADAEHQKKKSSVSGSGNIHQSNPHTDFHGTNRKNYGGFVPVKKKPGRLEPLPFKPAKLMNREAVNA